MKKTSPPSPDKKHGYFSNMHFVLKNQWQFEKRYIITMLANAPMRALASVIATFLPKIVLDCIENRVSPSVMLLRVFVAVFLAMSMDVGNKILDQSGRRDRTISENELFQMMLFQKTIDMDYNNFVFNDTRVLKEKATQALKGWNGNVSTCLPHNSFLFSYLFGFVSYTVIIARCNILFIPILVVSYGLSCLGWMLLQRYRDRHKKEWSAINQKLGYMTFRSKDFTSAKDIRIYNMVGFLQRKTNFHLAQTQKFETKFQNGHFINVFIEDLLKCLIGLAAYLYLIHQKLTTDMTLGDFSLYFGAITGFGVWLGKLVDSVSDVLECDHCIDDFRNFLELPDTMRKEDGVPLPDKTSYPLGIELSDIVFSYSGAKRATLDHISLSIKPGERIAVVGLNGAGKSTLVKVISGLLLPQSGTVRVGGTDSRDFNRDDYYSLFATVFQDVSLLPSSVAKNIALCGDREMDKDRLWTCIRLAGLEDKILSLPDKEDSLLVREVNEGATSFSGGELQRLLLARALYKDAPIIILDEPTAALDPIAENNMYLKYSELTRGKTSIYISHRLSSTRFCDRIILLDNNKICESGTHEELLALGGKYAEMFEIQSKYYRDEEVFA